MKPLFPLEEINNYKVYDKVPFECEICAKTFLVLVKNVKYRLKNSKKDHTKFCSSECKGKSYNREHDKNCKQCFLKIRVKNSDVKKSKTGNFFCSQSCAATYNNTHKKHGTRRSKLEFWIEMKLEYDFPDLKVIYNDRETTGLELDIYFPDLKLAVELNGIFHYEPIYGEEKLEKIQNKEKQKFKTCLEQKIELLIIDISSLGYFKPDKADVFYNIIKNIIIKRYGQPQKTTYPNFKSFVKLKEQEYFLNSKKDKYDKCSGCSLEKLKENKFCSFICANENKNGIDWQSINLEEEIKINSYSEIAKKLGCSKVSVHYRVKKLKLK